MLANKYILDKIESFDIGEPNILSDHHLVSFSLSTHLPSDCNEDAPSKQEQYQWDCIEPVHEISNNVVFATGKVSDQPAHVRSLI